MELPYLTSDCFSIGGRLKCELEDFQVEEIPAYLPCGWGEHLFAWIEKRDVSAEELVSTLSRQLHVGRREIGVAGLKDRRAVTRQFVSLPQRCLPAVHRLENDHIRVHSVARHRNKLKSGHLAGNRFSILVRDVVPDAFGAAQKIAAEICRVGAPNYYGRQRFGRDGQTLRCGLDLLTGRKQPHEIPKSRRRFLLRLALSAAQSQVFNHVLSDRVRDGLCHVVLEGDVVQLTGGHRTWCVHDATSEQPRLDRGELTLTGPMFGPRMIATAGQIQVREQRVLDSYGLDLASFERFRRLTPGARRSLLVRPGDLDVVQVAEGLRFQFHLPAGAYATTILREFQKLDPPQPERLEPETA